MSVAGGRPPPPHTGDRGAYWSQAKTNNALQVSQQVCAAPDSGHTHHNDGRLDGLDGGAVAAYRGQRRHTRQPRRARRRRRAQRAHVEQIQHSCTHWHTVDVTSRGVRPTLHSRRRHGRSNNIAADTANDSSTGCAMDRTHRRRHPRSRCGRPLARRWRSLAPPEPPPTRMVCRPRARRHTRCARTRTTAIPSVTQGRCITHDAAVQQFVAPP